MKRYGTEETGILFSNLVGKRRDKGMNLEVMVTFVSSDGVEKGR